MAIKQASGKVTFLRAHELDSGWGPSGDSLNDCEAIVKLANEPGFAFGFPLRQDERLPAREAMFQLLLAAYRNDWDVVIDYREKPGLKNHLVVRVAVE